MNILHRKSLILILLTLICFSAWGGELIQRDSKQSIAEFAKSVLPEGAELIHPVVGVSLKEAPNTVVAIYRDKSQATNFSGLVLIPGDKSLEYRKTYLPPMKEADGIFDIAVKSVFAKKNKSNNNNGLVVLYGYYRLGSGGESGSAGYFYTLDDNTWQIDDSLSEKLESVKNAQQAKAKLK